MGWWSQSLGWRIQSPSQSPSESSRLQWLHYPTPHQNKHSYKQNSLQRGAVNNNIGTFLQFGCQVNKKKNLQNKPKCIDSQGLTRPRFHTALWSPNSRTHRRVRHPTTGIKKSWQIIGSRVLFYWNSNGSKTASDVQCDSVVVTAVEGVVHSAELLHEPPAARLRRLSRQTQFVVPCGEQLPPPEHTPAHKASSLSRIDTMPIFRHGPTLVARVVVVVGAGALEFVF